MEEGGSLIHTTGIFVERRNLDTDTHIERMPCKHELSDGRGTYKSNHKKLGEAQSMFSLTASEGTTPADTFPASRAVRT